MYTRSLNIQNNSFFLFGPRGVGKSTWVRDHYQNAHRIDLLQTRFFLKLQQDPGELRKEVTALPKKSWVVLDEIQKVPALLDEVHALIEDFPNQYKFILTGSSARKLKREGGNLLAGRATTSYMYPLTAVEIGESFDLETSLLYGNLPLIWNSSTTEEKVARLEAYVETYLKEEIQQEAVVKNLSNFSRFLKVAAMSNAQKLNLSALARNTGVERSTAQGYFQVLIDTLLGDLIQPWPLKFRVKEVDHPKFYFFDTGVVRTLLNLQRDKMDKTDRGFLFETHAYHELKAYNRYKNIGGEFYFWGTHGGPEVDLIYTRGKKAVGFEIKATSKWETSHSASVRLLLEAGKINAGFGLYLGEKILNDHGVIVYPMSAFIQKIYSEEIRFFES